jgi:O-antigen ligase
MGKDTSKDCWCDWLSPLRLTLLAVNSVCFGGCLVLLATGKAKGSTVFLTVAVGMMFASGLIGALVASHRARKRGVTRTE